MPVAQLPQTLEKAGRRRHDTHVAGDRLDDDRRDLAAVRAAQALHGGGVVVVGNQRIGRRPPRHAGAGRHAQRGRAGPRLDQERVAVAVVAPGELDDPVAAGGGAGHAYRAHRRLGARVHEPDALDRDHEADDQPRQLHFLRDGRAEAGAAARGAAQRPDQSRRRMPVDERPPGHHVVDVGAPVDVADPRAPRPVDEGRLAADRAERAHGAVDAARQHGLGAREQLARFRASGTGHARNDITPDAGSGAGNLHGAGLADTAFCAASDGMTRERKL